jgi:PKD repeat protein
MKKIIKLTMVFSMLLFGILSSCEEEEFVGMADTKKPEATFQVTAEKFRAEEKIVFTDQSLDTDGFLTSWACDFGDGESSDKKSPEHFYAAGGHYTISLTVADNTGSLSKSFTKTISIEESLSTTPPTDLWI